MCPSASSFCSNNCKPTLNIFFPHNTSSSLLAVNNFLGKVILNVLSDFTELTKQTNKMSLLLVYTTVLTLMVCVGGNVCIIPQCNCNHVTDTIDCSTLGLHSVLYSSDTNNSTQLLLPHNHLQNFNICLLMAHLPMVKVIDLRDNDLLLCVDLARQRAPRGLTILSNCRNTTSRTSSSESNRNRTSAR